jgi:hypothetical protein
MATMIVTRVQPCVVSVTSLAPVGPTEILDAVDNGRRLSCARSVSMSDPTSSGPSNPACRA